MRYDLVIIGGGPAGYVAAERAAQGGLRVALFEKHALGGVCLNEGCIPTKILLYSAKLYDGARNGKKYGVLVDGVSCDYGKMVARKNKVVRKLVLGIEAKMRQCEVEVVRGEVHFDQSGEIYKVCCEGEYYEAHNLLICTGSEAFVPSIPGLEVGNGVVVTNRELLAEKELPAKLVIIGGGVIGMEFASLYNSMGAEVTVVEMQEEILPGIDAELSVMLREVYEKRGVKFHLGAKVVRVDGSEVWFERCGEVFMVDGERVLVSVGRRPNLDFLEGSLRSALEVERGGVKVDHCMRTSVPQVFAAGDVTGFSMLAHTASREAEVVVNNLLGKDDQMDYSAIPGIVYTNPELATVGLTEQAAREQGVDCRVYQLPMMYSGRFVAENEDPTGVCKVVADGQGKVIGVHILGNPASEIISTACVAIEQRMTVEQLRRVVFPHPTVGEIMKEVL